MRILLASLLLMVVSGCAKVVDDFVADGDGPMTPPTTTTNDTEDGALKLSPGMVRASGGTVGMTARITNDRLLMTGSNVSATIGLHKSR